MRVIQNILIVFCLVLLLVMALLVLAQRAPWEPVANFGKQVLGSEIIEESIEPNIPYLSQNVLLWLAVAAVLVIGLLALRRLREEVHITRETEDGTVTIVESAITRYIRQVAMDLESVQNVRTVVTNTGEGMVIDLYSRVRVTDSLTRIEKRIRERMRQALEEMLGLGSVATINVIVEGFELVRGAAPTAAVAEVVEEPAAAKAPPYEEPPAEEPAIEATVEEPTVIAEPEEKPAAADKPVSAWNGFEQETVVDAKFEEAESLELPPEREEESAAEVEEAEPERPESDVTGPGNVEDEPESETPESDRTEKRD